MLEGEILVQNQLTVSTSQWLCGKSRSLCFKGNNLYSTHDEETILVKTVHVKPEFRPWLLDKTSQELL